MYYIGLFIMTCHKFRNKISSSVQTLFYSHTCLQVGKHTLVSRQSVDVDIYIHFVSANIYEILIASTLITFALFLLWCRSSLSKFAIDKSSHPLGCHIFVIVQSSFNFINFYYPLDKLQSNS